MQRMVVIMLAAVAMEPKPPTRYAQNPIIRAVPLGEGLGRQWGISEPADIRGAARAAQSFTADIAEVEQQPAKRA